MHDLNDSVVLGSEHCWLGDGEHRFQLLAALLLIQQMHERCEIDIPLAESRSSNPGFAHDFLPSKSKPVIDNCNDI